MDRRLSGEKTAGARKRVENTEAAVQHKDNNMILADIAGLTSREPEKTIEEMLIAIAASLSDHASSNNGKDVDDEDDEVTEQGNLSEDDEPGWVMRTITKTVQPRMERFRQKKMKLDELTQPGWEDAAGYFHQRDRKYGTTELRVPAVVQPQTKDHAPASPPASFGEHRESLHIVPEILGRPQGTSQPGICHIRRGTVNTQSKSSIPSGEPAAEHDSSTLLKEKPVEPVSFYPCI
jgi:hypothetical protein